MAHLIDPCLRATKIAHGIRRGIDGLSPLSGLVPELRILIQEQKNVLTSLKRTAFEKEEAAKHLAIYAKTEGPDISDTLSKLSLLIQKAADLERDYSASLGQSRELFKEIRVAEDENYSVRKRKLDLEQKLSVDKSHVYQSKSPSNSSTSVLRGSEMHPEMKLLRQETMQVENELEDLKRKRIKKATAQQLDALEKLGKELIVVAHYGREIMTQLDDSPTPAGSHADEHFGAYDGAARTAYAVKACLDTFKTWSSHEPKVLITEVDMGDFPKDTKGALDAMLQDLAVKSGSDWFNLQSPSPGSSSPKHNRASSISSSTGSASPRNSMSSNMTTMTYVDGVPMVQVINEIPPTPELEDGPGKVFKDTSSGIATPASVSGASTPKQEPIPVFVAPSSSVTASTTTATQEEEEEEEKKKKKEEEGVSAALASETPSQAQVATTANAQPSPFVPKTTYTPATTYQAASHGASAGQHGAVDGRKSTSPPVRTRPLSGEHHHYSAGHAPHPLMMQSPPQFQQQPHLQSYPPGPPGGIGAGGGGGPLPTHMPIPMPMPMPMQMPRPTYDNVPIIPMSMPIPHIPGSPPNSGHTSNNKRHSQPISVSFPLRPPTSTSPIPPAQADLAAAAAPFASSTTTTMTSASMTSRTPSPSSRPTQERRNPHAVLPPAEPGFRIPVGVGEEHEHEQEQGQGQGQGRPSVEEQQHQHQHQDEKRGVVSHDDLASGYDGPPPDYAEASMQPPAEKREEKKR
ncbi:hypothetical protein EC968_006779 [Mortierella alpina]|nr:hypothetical protein EC968_006779 [Mortierella alpina]